MDPLYAVMQTNNAGPTLAWINDVPYSDPGGTWGWGTQLVGTKWMVRWADDGEAHVIELPEELRSKVKEFDLNARGTNGPQRYQFR